MEKLIAAQEKLHGRIVRSCENLKKTGVANITPAVLQAALNLLDSKWAKFEAQHEALLLEFGAMLEEDPYLTGNVEAQVENDYLIQRGRLSDLGAKLFGAPATGRAGAALPDPGEAKLPSHPRNSLPRIHLPPFSGKFEDWPNFRDLFSAIVANEASLTPAEKMHYLKTLVQGDAEQLISGLPTSGENFEPAWSILKSHFENKRQLVRTYLTAYIALPRMRDSSADNVRSVFRSVVSTYGALAGIGRPVSDCTDVFVQLAVDKFDAETRGEWETALGRSAELPTYERLRDFLEEQLFLREAIRASKQGVSGGKPCERSTRSTRANHLQKRRAAPSRSCPACKKDHFVMLCEVYKTKTAQERRELVEGHQLCQNCLGRHSFSECPSTKACMKCAARHHTSLHEAYVFARTLLASPSPATAPATTVHGARGPSIECSSVLLATARVTVADRCGNRHRVRVLVDPGSETSLISEALAQRLRLPRTPTAVTIFGVGGVQSGVARGRVSVTVASSCSDAAFRISALVLPRLSVYGGWTEPCDPHWRHTEGLELADPDFGAQDPVELLLGADAYAHVALPGLRRGKPGEPIAQQTQLGWILLGATGTSPASAVSSLQCTAEEDLSALVRKFWEQEELPRSKPALLPDEQRCEDHFSRTHSRDPSGRYTVRLPVRSDLPDLTATRRAALRLMDAMRRKFQRDPAFRQLYETFLDEYLSLEHMSPVTAEHQTARTCYLPHHGVLKGSGSSAKIRVVFNGSCRQLDGASLNASLLTGPNLLPPLCDVVTRWRRHQFVVTADINKMYRQVWVHNDDRDLQRVLWTLDGTLYEYRLNTITYGLACAPYLAIRTLHQLAEDVGPSCPLAATALRRDTYMDDVLAGAASLEEALRLRDELTTLCTAGCFPLRKWAANDARLLTGIPDEHRLRGPAASRLPSDEHSVLGVRWNPAEDTFSFAVYPPSKPEVTKRSILSGTARLFDPLGWLAPIVVRAKLIIQHTWLQQVGWDDPLAEEEASAWRRLQDELPLLEALRVPRWLRCDLPGSLTEIHGFSDASERAYAAVIYVRTLKNELVTVSLVQAKTKVAPLKQISLPRLELSAAALLVRLTVSVRAALELEGNPVHLWTDSTVTLGWIRGHPTQWTTFVANRVSEIQTTLPEAQWHHVPGRENPADCASRGLHPAELLPLSLWWRGPEFLASSAGPWLATGTESMADDLPEQRARRCLTSQETAEPRELTRFSSLRRLLRVTAWMRRWRASARLRSESPSPEELDAAQDGWIRVAQRMAFRSELDACCRGADTPRRSLIRRLNPFIDERGLLRVGGRLKHAALSQEQRHPVILPAKSHLTRLLVEAHHRRTLHGGAQLTLASLRQRFWIPSGRQLVRSFIHRCVSCARWRAAAPQPRMANLPRSRVTPGRPFLHTGVDFAGPYQLRTSRGRGHRSYKAYLAVFICFSTRAVHLEVVSDYTSEAFLAAFRRFVSRRGLCEAIYSDRGTNFVGADSQLRALFRQSGREASQLVRRLADEGVTWHFNPPAAPHFGGLWEAAVKSTKHHLRRVVGEATLTYEEMSTLLTEIEACLNSRPLRALTDDPEDLDALTPGHFLIGAPLLAVPEPSLKESPPNRLNRLQLLQRMRDHLWARWSQEYLQGLAPRAKWWADAANPKEGQLCLIRNEATPPTRWPLARIARLLPGKDGCVRVVIVRTPGGELTRPVVKIVPLPVADADVPI